MNKLKPEAVMVECNHGGIELANITSESLWWRRNWGEGAISEWKEAEIEYSSCDNDGEIFTDSEGEIDSRPYFTIGNLDSEGNEWMYFLDEFLMIQR